MPEGRCEEPVVVRGDALRNFLKLHAGVVAAYLAFLVYGGRVRTVGKRL